MVVDRRPIQINVKSFPRGSLVYINVSSARLDLTARYEQDGKIKEGYK